MENKYNALCDINATHCYLPTDMEEDNPLDLENIKEKQDHESAVKYPEWYSYIQEARGSMDN
jgi:hypothetical protein